ncbi:MAG: SPFH domain-containing protein [Chloroflexota bacterium]
MFYSSRSYPQISARGRRFILVTLGLLIIGSVLSDHLGFRFGPVGGIFWAIAFLISFFVNLAYFSLFTLPTGVQDGYEEGFRLIWRYFFYQRKSHSRAPRIDGIPPAVYELGSGIVDSHVTLGVGRRRSFSRGVGPGFVQLAPGEFIQQVIDLRHHHREMRVQAVTRDGIPLEAVVGVTFMVDRISAGDQNEEIPFPVDPQAIFKVSYFATVDEGEATIIWSERVAPFAAAALVSELSNHELDAIYPMGLETATGPVREAPIRMLARSEQQVFKAVEKKLRGHGLTLVGITISDLELPPNIHQEHIYNLQRIWEAEITAETERSPRRGSSRCGCRTGTACCL